MNVSPVPPIPVSDPSGAATPERRRIDDLIRRAGELPPMPAVAERALGLIRNPHSSMADLADVLALDQAMTSLVLRWANSPYYGLKHPVSTVRQAVVYLGQNTIQSLVLAASIAAFMDRPAPGYGLERGELWRHAVGVAAGARLALVHLGPHLAEEAYHAGLLSDIGKLALDVALRGIDTGLAEWQDRPFTEVEVNYFGVDHAALGAEMARRWNLPAPLVDAIAHHHRPAEAGEGAALAAAVHVADAAMMFLGVGVGRDGLRYPLDPAACERLGWTEASFETLVERVAPLVGDLNRQL